MSLHKAHQELDCTDSCSFEKHAETILATAALGNLRLLQHCASLCGNPFQISDRFGRTPLHVASSLGHQAEVEWLARRGGVNTADRESKWTALHRSLFYGHLGVAVRLVKHGAHLDIKDFDRSTPLSILNGNKSYFKPQLTVSEVNVYTWGSNSNVTLGHDHTRRHPERLDLPPHTTITQAVVCKFHSVFLTAGGRVLTCGHGRGGRLGHGTEQSVVQLYEVKALTSFLCVGIAAARDHTVILTKNGVVYTCGLNDAHQLGLGSNPTNAPKFCLEPKPVNLRGSKNRQMVAVGAGRYHTAMSTTSEVFTAGKNLGQLGYEANYDTQITPRAVVGIVVDADDQIVHLSASDAATACITRRHRIFVCTDFIVKSIRCSFLEKLSCVLFSVCASLSDMDHLRKISSEPKKVMVLDSDNKLWCWEPATKGSVPTLLEGLAAHNVANFSFGKCLSIVTCDGEVFSGPISSSRQLELKRLPLLQNTHAVFTDFKANNFVCLQNVYKSPQLPCISESEFSSHIASLLEEDSLDPTLSDIEVKCGGTVFPGNRCVLASLSTAMSHLLEGQNGGSSQSPPATALVTWNSEAQLVFNCTSRAVAEALLYYAYGVPVRLYLPRSVNGTAADISVELTPDTSVASIDENDLTAEYDKYSTPNFTQEFGEFDNKVPLSIGQSTPIKDTGAMLSRPSTAHSTVKDLHLPDRRTDLRSLLELAELFQVSSLKKQLQSVLSSNLQKPHVLLSPPHKLRLKRQPQFSDLVLASEEERTICCHKCILVVRSEYFRSMLLMGWRETSSETETLKLPIKYQLLKAVIDYIYTDVCPSLKETCTLDWVTSVLVVADQLLLTRLKELCEHELAKMLDLRNAAEVLEFAEAYSAAQLKQSCLQFICCNASSLLEGRLLDGLGVSLLSDLSSVYRELAPAVAERKIVFKEPDIAALPQSYFLNDSDTEQCEVFGDSTTSFEATLWAQESESDGSLLQSTPHSGSRKKRKRKSSHSKTFSPPISPEPVFEEATASSPRQTTPSGGGNQNHPNLSPSPTSYANTTPRREKSSIVRHSTTHPNTDNHGTEKYSTDKHTTETHSTETEKLTTERPSTVKPTTERPNAERRPSVEAESISCGKSFTRSGWESLPSRQCTGDLRVIMAQEEREQQRKTSLESLNYKPKKLFAEGSSVSTSDHRHKHTPITIPKSPEDESSHPEHRTVSPLSRSNPWKREGYSQSPPPVSLRELIAEAEAKEKKQRKAADVRQEPQSEHKPHTERGPPPAPVIHRQVSFSDVMKAQKVEQDGQRRSSLGSSKHLSFIQIEERARLDLERLYGAHDNPDEFITIEQFRPSQKVFC